MNKASQTKYRCVRVFRVQTVCELVISENHTGSSVEAGSKAPSNCRPHTLELRCPSLPLPLHNFISHNKTSSSSTLRLQPWVSIVGSLILTASIHLGHPRSVFDALHSACCCHHLKAKFGRGCKTRHRWLSSASHSAAKLSASRSDPRIQKRRLCCYCTRL